MILHLLAAPLADARLDDVAMDTHRLLPMRVGSAALVALIVSPALGWMLALAWLSALIAGEGLARAATRRFSREAPGSQGLRAAFLLAALPINMIWAALAAALWLSPQADLKLAAVAIWAGQIVYTHNFRHQPWALIAVSAVMPLASLIVFPVFFFEAQGLGPNTARWGMLILVLTTINVMIANRAAARRMDELTQGLREERERALEAARAKSTFIAVASHELRTPMNGMLGMAHALSRSNLDDAQREQVRLMLKSGDNLMQLLNDVLDLSRIESSKVELATEPFSLQTLIDEIMGAWRDIAVVKNLDLTAVLAPSVPAWIEGDALRVRQVLVNLISNALKFTAQGGVHLMVTSPEATLRGRREIRFAVRDSGPGIPTAASERVFESFTQVDDTVSRQHGGAGLGLTIARALARQMGGDLTLAPSPHGACFEFSLMAPETTPRAAAEPDSLEDEGVLRTVRILMAEDNKINQLVVQTMLEATGLSLTVADNGQAALEAMAEGCFDCVLMDINMPVMDGITALQAIRSGAAGDPDMPVIALTASTLTGDRERFLEMGFSDHLGKPVKPADLINAIVRAINPDTPGADALHNAA